MTRQRRWQLKRVAEGKCMTCGDPVAEHSTSRCQKHLDIVAAYREKSPTKYKAYSRKHYLNKKKVIKIPSKNKRRLPERWGEMDNLSTVQPVL